MKFQSYRFEDGQVRLEFSFVEDEKLIENKEKFVALLKQALKTLEGEIPLQVI